VAAYARDHAGRIVYHQYLQYLCDQQLADAAVRGSLEIGFIRDLAVGCAPDGAEAWAAGDAVAHGVSVGAPPDPFSAEGQVWGLPPPVPHLMATDGYSSFAGLLRANMRHAGGLRIDHAMGLARLFWVPEGARGADGTYVRYPFEDLLGQLALESARARALVIGEDLGTVPPGLREAMHDNDILSYRVLLLEREGRGFKPRTSYPSRAVACVSTHDLPTFAGWLSGADIDERAALGQSQQPETEHADRAQEVSALRQTLATHEDLTAAAHGFVAKTPADLVYVQADDLAGELQAVNLPGTDRERPNWRRRLDLPLDQIFENPLASRILASLQSRKAPP
jgi:glycogen operon protein